MMKRQRFAHHRRAIASSRPRKKIFTKHILLRPVFAISFIGVVSVCFTITAQSVAKGPMRDITAKELVWDMKIGWNLGNTLDAPDGETTWGNPLTTKAMMDAVRAMGFKTVRIPVTWDKHMGGPPDYTVDKAWMDRVETVANYVLDNGMYAIINTHHDEWVSLTGANQSAVKERIRKLWSQIAIRFKDYSDYLLFETFNEPRQPVNEWNGGTPEARAILNEYHKTAVDAIRATGGNNAERFILICGHGATPTTECIKDIVIPNGNDPRCIISLHTYFPQNFCFPDGSASSWGSSEEQLEVVKELNRERIDVSSKGGGTAIISEWGSADKNNLSSRVEHAEFYSRQARSKGMLPVWWDNGSKDFGLLNRKTSPPSWTWPDIARALVKGAEDATSPLTSLIKDGKTEGLRSALTVRGGAAVYTLSRPGCVSLRILSPQGRGAVSYIQSFHPAGNYSVDLAQQTLSSGCYLLEFRTDSFLESTKIFSLR